MKKKVRGGANLISFTMTMDPSVPSLYTYPEIVYQAEEGMTWIDWCASSYNINGYSIIDTVGGLKVMHNYGGYGGLVCQGLTINADTIIEDGGVYYYE